MVIVVVVVVVVVFVVVVVVVIVFQNIKCNCGEFKQTKDNVLADVGVRINQTFQILIENVHGIDTLKDKVQLVKMYQNQYIHLQ